MFLKVVLPLLVALVVGGTLVAVYRRAHEQQQNRTGFFWFEFLRLAILVAVVGGIAVYGLWDRFIGPLFR